MKLYFRITAFTQYELKSKECCREEDLKRFFNPNSERTRRIFIDYFDVDVTKGWAWDNYDSGAAKRALDKLVTKRGDAAHQANTAEHPSAEPHKIRRDELEKGIRFLQGLVSATDKVPIAAGIRPASVGERAQSKKLIRGA